MQQLLHQGPPLTYRMSPIAKVNKAQLTAYRRNRVLYLNNKASNAKAGIVTDVVPLVIIMAIPPFALPIQYGYLISDSHICQHILQPFFNLTHRINAGNVKIYCHGAAATPRGRNRNRNKVR